MLGYFTLSSNVSLAALCKEFFQQSLKGQASWPTQKTKSFHFSWTSADSKFWMLLLECTNPGPPSQHQRAFTEEHFWPRLLYHNRSQTQALWNLWPKCQEAFKIKLHHLVVPKKQLESSLWSTGISDALQEEPATTIIAAFALRLPSKDSSHAASGRGRYSNPRHGWHDVGWSTEEQERIRSQNT